MKTRLALLIVGILILAASASAQNAAAVFAKVSPSVVVVKGKTAQGSGVAISVKTAGFGKETTIVTNCHVVAGEVVVAITHLSKTGYATVKSCDIERDIALVYLPGELPTVAIRSAASLIVGERVYAVGAPRGLDLTISDGIVSQLRRDGIANRVTPMIQTTAAISPGSSGGGLFDAQGRLVGVTTLYLKDAQALNFAIPSDWITQAMSQVSTGVAKAGPQVQVTKAQPQCGWVKVGETANVDSYIDHCTIKQLGRYRMILELSDFKTQKNWGGGSFKSSVKRIAYNCSIEHSAIVSAINYSDAMGLGSEVKSYSWPENEWEFSAVIVGSIGKTTLRAVCR